jgi:hypothetical protein
MANETDWVKAGTETTTWRKWCDTSVAVGNRDVIVFCMLKDLLADEILKLETWAWRVSNEWRKALWDGGVSAVQFAALYGLLSP